MHAPTKTLALLAAGSALGLASASAATLTLTVAGDSYIRSGAASGANATTNNNGSQLLLVGDTTTPNDVLRAVLSFNLNDPLLAGATINSVTLSLFANGKDTSSTTAATVTIDLLQLGKTFTESQVTWNIASTGNAWTTVGGDFSSTVLSSVNADASTVAANQAFNFASSADFIGSVANTLLQTDKTLNLLVKLDAEDPAVRSVFRLNAGTTSGTQSSLAAAQYRPQLVIDYTAAAAVPEPASFAALAGAGMLGFAALRRRARR